MYKLYTYFYVYVVFWPDKISSILNKLSLLFKNDLANRYQASKLENAHGVLYDACQAFKSEPVSLKREILNYIFIIKI